MDIKGKKILFIGTGFFDYEESIIEELKRRGAIITYFSSAITSITKRILIRLGYGSIASVAVCRKLNRLINDQPEDIDYIIIIKADNFSEKHVKLLKRKYPNIPIVLYLWDSLRWLHNRDVILANFKNILTFDRNDAEKYHLKFRPLFCRAIEDDNSPIVYDVSFVGSSHTIRYDFLKKIRKQLDNSEVKYRFILRTGKFSLLIGKYLTHSIKKDDEDWFVSTPIKYEDYIRISRSSNVILDIANPNQTGLTIRTIETIGFSKKLLTTNTDIISYGFNPDNYRVINIDNPVVDMDFIKQRDEVTYDLTGYLLGDFVNDLLNSLE